MLVVENFSHEHRIYILILVHVYFEMAFCRTPLKPDQEVSEPDWEVYLRETANMIIQQQSPRRLLEVRGRLYELLTHCIPADIIMKVSVTLSLQTMTKI